MKKFLISISVGVLLLAALPLAHAVTNPETISSVVLIDVVDSAGENFIGTGVVISNDILIVTAAHVIIDENTGLPADEINLCVINTEFDIPNCIFRATVLAYDEEIDLALLAPQYNLDSTFQPFGDPITIEEAQAIEAPYVDFADDSPALGDAVSIFGYPAASLSPSVTLTQGTISSFIPLDENLIWFYTTDATINPGNSGGPVHNSDERVIGIVTAVSTEGIGGNYGYIISTDIIASWFLDLVNQGILNNAFVESTFNNDYLTEIENTDLNNVGIFTDVTINSPNAEAIAYLKNQNIISGYPEGDFRPTGKLNRAELMKILVEGVGLDPDPAVYRNCFPDVNTQWFAKYVCLAKEQGWIVGYPDGDFKPGNFINKAESLKMLLEVFEIDLIYPIEPTFTDVAKAEWFAPYVETAQVAQLLEETGANYYPGDEITRGQISENIYRLLLLGENFEQIAFVAALVDTICLTNGFEGEPDEATLETINDIYANYGFPVEDDIAMNDLFEKYADDEEIDLAIAAGTQDQCPGALDNFLISLEA